MSEKLDIDRTDLKILDVLQHDANRSIAEIGERVGLSQTPCWKRIQRLERLGVITRRVALLEASKLDLSLTVFVTVTVGDHSEASLTRFKSEVGSFPEVLDIYRLAGEHDYILRVVLPGLKDYDAFYKKLIETMPLKKVTSHVAIESVKSTTALPLNTSLSFALVAAE